MSQFLICGPIGDDDAPTYWNNDQGWVSDSREATTLPRQILTSPLPEGSVGILELTMFGFPVSYFELVH